MRSAMRPPCRTPAVAGTRGPHRRAPDPARQPPAPPAWAARPATARPAAAADGRARGEPPSSAPWPAAWWRPLVATGVTVALDDDASAPVDRPVVTPVTTSEGTLDIQAILAKVQPSVVTIQTSAETSQGLFEGAGSGIVLSADGLVLTNAHVIGSIGDITVVLADGTEHPATLVGSSPDDDLAVIQVRGRRRPGAGRARAPPTTSRSATR